MFAARTHNLPSSPTKCVPRQAQTQAIVRTVALLCCLAIVQVGCSAIEPTPTSFFAGPGGMVQAGSSGQYVFVANASVDALHVIKLAPSMVDVDLVPGPARYFPLYIPAGPHPTELAATPSGAYVFVLDAVTAALTVVDADTLRTAVDAAGKPLYARVGPANGAPGSMVASPNVNCASAATVAGSTCLGRVYVALRDLGEIAVVDLLRDPGANGALQVQVTDVVDVGGAPLRLAVHPDREVLFATDALAPHVVRINLEGGRLQSGGAQVSRFALSEVSQEPGGPLAVSHDKSLLVVGRPQSRDVAILTSDPQAAAGAAGQQFDVADGLLQLVDARPQWTPMHTCLQSCGDVAGQSCAHAHPADVALCVAADGLAEVPNNAYKQLFVDAISTHIVSVVPTAATLSAPCDQQVRQFNQAVAVVTLQGHALFVGLRDTANAFSPQLITPPDGCAAPTLTAPNGEPTPASYLTACPQAPDSPRFACLAVEPKTGPQTGQVLVLPGRAGNTSWHLQWEGVIAPTAPLGSTGMINAAGFVEVSSAAFDLDAIAVATPSEAGAKDYLGDILEVTSGLKASASCQDAAACVWQRHITKRQGTLLELDAPLPVECFEVAQGRSITFTVRAAERFMVHKVLGDGAPAPVTRLALGQSFGFGAQVGFAEAVYFQLQNLPLDVSRNLCQKYQKDTGALIDNGLQSPLLTRDRTLHFGVQDPFRPLQRGVRMSQMGSQEGSVGYLPGGALLTRTWAGQPSRPPWLMVSYAGSNAVLVADPLDAPQLVYDDKSNKMLQ